MTRFVKCDLVLFMRNDHAIRYVSLGLLLAVVVSIMAIISFVKTQPVCGTDPTKPIVDRCVFELGGGR